MSVLVIAEIGINHGGDYSQALRMIDAAKEAGADIAKFQLFRDRPEIEHLRLTENDLMLLAAHCAHREIEFACTPFYREAVPFVDSLVKRHKIASGFVKDRAMLDAVSATGKPVIISTGMSTQEDVWRAIEGRHNLALLHCVSLYPCPDEKANLCAMGYLDAIGWPWGYSDHTVGTLACVAAVAIGAQIIEKHLTFDRYAEGPDHACSAEPHEFAEMVSQIRRVEKML